jgi:hypothetical protein
VFFLSVHCCTVGLLGLLVTLIKISDTPFKKTLIAQGYQGGGGNDFVLTDSF